MVWVESGLVGSKKLDFAPFALEPFEESSGSDDFRVRHLIAKLVHESVRDFHLKEREGAFKLLTAESLAAGLATGKIGRPRDEAQQVDVDGAVGNALQAFEDGLYLLFVDNVQKTTLDERVTLAVDSRVRLIRLTALSGR